MRDQEVLQIGNIGVLIDQDAMTAPEDLPEFLHGKT
jgi:hypothetical protein